MKTTQLKLSWNVNGLRAVVLKEVLAVRAQTQA